jgi:long-chain acyl-CoA synthetase
MPEPFWEKSYPPGVSWWLDFQPKPIFDVLDEATTNYPNNPCVDFMDKKLSYADISDLVDRAAKGFQEIGVTKGTHVGLYLPNTPHYIVCFYAILKAGGIVVNYSPLDAAQELEHKIIDSETDILVTLDLNLLYLNMAPMLEKTRLKKLVIGSIADFLPFPKNLLFPFVRSKDLAKIPNDDRHVSYKKLIANDGRYESHPFGDLSEEIAVLQYTGGTTGLPKGAMLTHGNLTATVMLLDQWGQGENPIMDEGAERFLVVLPLFHIFALSIAMLMGMRGAAELILHPRFELDDVIRDIGRKKPTFFPGVPTMYTALLGHPEAGKVDMSSLKFCNSGGAPLPVDVQQRFEAATGCKLVEGWGMTETCAPGIATPIVGLRKEGAAGIPMPGITVEFVDVEDPLKLLPYGETGEICVTGPNIMKGYWNNPEATEEVFAGGRMHTGDIGYMDEDGFVYIVDRKKDMITSGGYNVYPRNIEDAIYQHPDVEECTVIGIPDEYRGESAKAFIKLKAGASEFDITALREFLADKLGKHELPKAVDFREELPKTPVGKLSKKELVEEERLKRENA